ncbi:hypothetical protein JB92DRAFT_2932840 [Gautieria morchelliformis]|nr:hypothetical protein JB92DRAFT_2932840 [Gautieria morchelliformis]
MSVARNTSVARNKLYLVGRIEMNHSESFETQGNPAAMLGTVTSVLEYDPLQTPITLSLEELLAISPAISDGLLRSFPEDKSPESIVCFPSHQDILYVPCLTVIGALGKNQSGAMSQHTCAMCSHAFSTTRRLKRHTRVHRSYGVTPTSSCAASSAPSHARVAPHADVSHTRNAGIGATHGNSATLEPVVQTCGVARQPRTNTHLHARAHFRLYHTPPLPSSRAHYTPMHFSWRHRLPSHCVPSSPPLSLTRTVQTECSYANSPRSHNLHTDARYGEEDAREHARTCNDSREYPRDNHAGADGTAQRIHRSRHTSPSHRLALPPCTDSFVATSQPVPPPTSLPMPTHHHAAGRLRRHDASMRKLHKPARSGL